MASNLSSLMLFLLFSVGALSAPFAQSQDDTWSLPALDAAEQESVYRVLASVNSAIPWRSLFPDDLCSSAPHGVVCEYFSESASPSALPDSVHVTELSFGYVSDNSPFPPCSPSSTLDPALFTSLSFLRKLFFYKCFNATKTTPFRLPAVDSLEEIVFVENPSLSGELEGSLGNFTTLRRLILTGTGISGEIPDSVGNLVNLEELTLSRNNLSGEIPPALGKLGSLKILDLSHNGFRGILSESVVCCLLALLKLDLSHNGISGRIPEILGARSSLEFLDLSFNRFENLGFPAFLPRLQRLKEVYLSGNSLGGEIPDSWRSLGRLERIGLSGTGLVGSIPSSMGVYLKNLTYLGLENNGLGGSVPEELGLSGSLVEINLDNNSLSGRVFFSAAPTFSALKLSGNPNLCVDETLWASRNGSLSFGQVKLCEKPAQIPKPVPLNDGSSSSSLSGKVLPSMALGFVALLVAL